MTCQIHILRPDETPKHSNLPWWKNLSYWTICNRGVLDLNKYEILPMLCACAVPCRVLETLKVTPKHSNFPYGNFFFVLTHFVFGVRSVCKTTKSCQCCVHAISVVMSLEAWCGTQTFELDVSEKNFFFLYKFVFGVCSICKTTTMPPALAIPWSEFGAMIRPPSIRTCRNSKFVVVNNFGSRGGLDLQNYDRMSMSCACAVGCCESRVSKRHPSSNLLKWKNFVYN